jgi:DNA-binding GntR family transcriptional regulator
VRLQPRALQAAEAVREMIAAGALRPGDPAPTIAGLREATGTSAYNCYAALGELERDGTLRAHGRGRVVAGTAPV